MPYIKREQRSQQARLYPADAGQLNYAITDLCLAYLKDKGKRYATINEIVGALDCAKLEFYRRLAAPYEDVKIAENGDIEGYKS